MKTITVKGTGKSVCSPDTTAIGFALETVCADYAECVKKSDEIYQKLAAAIIGCGFKKNALKTSDYSVYAKYENVREGNEYKNKFAGYCCTRNVNVKFKTDFKLLGSILSASAASGSNAHINISFTLKNPEKAAETALKRAAEDCRTKAEILAEAAGVKLKQIIAVEYGSKEMHPVSPTVYKRSAETFAAANVCEITPEDIEHTESATITWEIE